MRKIAITTNQLRVIAIVVLATFSASVFLTKTSLERNAQASLRDAPQAIYSRDPKDPWNSIFYHLFTRTVRARHTDEFPESGPFLKLQVMGFPQGLPVSTRLFERLDEAVRVTGGGLAGALDHQNRCAVLGRE